MWWVPTSRPRVTSACAASYRATASSVLLVLSSATPRNQYNVQLRSLLVRLLWRGPLAPLGLCSWCRPRASHAAVMFGQPLSLKAIHLSMGQRVQSNKAGGPWRELNTLQGGCPTWMCLGHNGIKPYAPHLHIPSSNPHSIFGAEHGCPVVCSRPSATELWKRQIASLFLLTDANNTRPRVCPVFVFGTSVAWNESTELVPHLLNISASSSSYSQFLFTGQSFSIVRGIWGRQECVLHIQGGSPTADPQRGKEGPVRPAVKMKRTLTGFERILSWLPQAASWKELPRLCQIISC